MFTTHKETTLLGLLGQEAVVLGSLDVVQDKQTYIEASQFNSYLESSLINCLNNSANLEKEIQFLQTQLLAIEALQGLKASTQGNKEYYTPLNLVYPLQDNSAKRKSTEDVRMKSAKRKKKSPCQYCAELGVESCGLFANKCPNRPCSKCTRRHRYNRCRKVYQKQFEVRKDQFVKSGAM
eukprot:snap_masked-scaffold_5-processed-gene-7.38-mRNA-1 protein AED:1.00 eAED:1.00 QI:0/-1/0/0/-1/1/1/0/179